MTVVAGSGAGVYRSGDGGKTWEPRGLADSRHIGRLWVDPRNADVVLVAAQGHIFGPNAERGLYRSADGGLNFTKVLGKDENTGASEVQIDPSHPDTVYAALWEARQGPWENSAWSGPGGGMFKSTDGGTTWRPLTNGIPSGADGFIQRWLLLEPIGANGLTDSAVQAAVNSRPRKILDWKTPAEVLDEHLRLLHQAGVATTG